MRIWKEAWKPSLKSCSQKHILLIVHILWFFIALKMYFFLRNNILTCTKIYDSFTLINVEAWRIVLTMEFPFLLTKEKKKLPQVSACAASAKCMSSLGLCSHFSTKSCDSNGNSKPRFWWNWWCLQRQTRVLSGFSQSPQKLQWNVGPSLAPRHSPPRHSNSFNLVITLWNHHIHLVNEFIPFFKKKY